MNRRLRWPDALAGALLALLPLALTAFAALQGIPFTLTALLERALFVAALLGATRVTRRWPRSVWLVAALALVAGGLYALTRATASAWVLLAAFYALLLWLDAWFERGVSGTTAATRRTFFVWLHRGLLALMAGLLPIALVQAETHFADEEFFTLLEVVVLAGGWLLINALLRLQESGVGGRGLGVGGPENQEPKDGSSPHHIPHPASRRHRVIVSLCHCVILAFTLVATARAYQHSFFPLDAPTYPGISDTAPFLCGTVAAAPETFDSAAVFQRVMAQVAANPNKDLPEYGMLAAGTGDAQWGSAFRARLLQEAHDARFTGAADSVKSVQGDAAIRVYYYVLVQKRFPTLFSADNQRAVRQWFAAINRRAQTVEWVDWMYALAFNKTPEGPYENQENGAGLLALLEANGLGDPALAAQNRDYLARNVRGWTERFRNTDDTAIYQFEWLRNALFQAQYTKQMPAEHLRQSFEWLLLQTAPDMSILRYNHPYGSAPIGFAALGALLLNDPRYEWLAGRSLARVVAKNGTVNALPGVERAAQITGSAPTQGSCLLYGDSGIPTAQGPLAPDKLVFRDGWNDDANYLLVNLRFSGWHRYKATGTLMSLVQNGPLLGEVTDGKPFAWLPTGRSIFRDKRIPRENLNGLVVERTGLSAVLNTLTTFGGAWAQDPPYYAHVEQFAPGADRDSARITLDDWHGWQQRRTITFIHNGPIVVEDDASGPTGAHAALMWHPTAAGPMQNGRIPLRGGDAPAEMVVLPLDAGAIQAAVNGAVQYNASANGRLHTATVFLTRDWVGADAHIERNTLRIVKGTQQITLPLASDAQP